jgi:hypothetical protein
VRAPGEYAGARQGRALNDAIVYTLDEDALSRYERRVLVN